MCEYLGNTYLTMYLQFKWIDLDMEGGTTPYNIRWQKNEEDIAETSAVLSQLGPGTYRAFIEDAAGCKSQTDRMTVTLPLPLDAAVASTPTRCFRSSTGSIKLDIIDGLVSAISGNCPL